MKADQERRKKLVFRNFSQNPVFYGGHIGFMHVLRGQRFLERLKTYKSIILHNGRYDDYL